MAATGGGLLLRAGWIGWTGKAMIHGRHHIGIYHGAQAQEWAAAFACFGIATFGAFAHRAWVAGAWIGLWLVGGVAVVLLPAFA